jgi:hypothetical protein
MNRTSLIHRISAALTGGIALSAMVLAGCSDGQPAGVTKLTPGGTGKDDPTKAIPEQPAPFVGGDKNTFDHFIDLGANGGRDPFDILAQRQEEGAPEIRTRLHSCQKLQNSAVQSLLAGFGVDLAKTGNPAPAGQLYNEGTGALGAANYDARVGETIVWSSAGAAKLFDIFVQAAPEIIANISTVPQCQVNGAGPEMFDADNKCNTDAVSCLIGVPASADHVAVCSNAVKAASDIGKGKNIAVAALLSAAFSCE